MSLNRVIQKDQSQQLPQELLFQACRELNYDKAVLAIDQGADVNAMASYTCKDSAIFNIDNLKFSPLSLIAMHGETKIGNAVLTDEKACQMARLLLSHGADIDVLDTGDMGNSPLHWAIVTFKKQLCKLFIQHAVDNQKKVINLANKPHRTQYGSNPPLILALKASSQYFVYGCEGMEIAELLIGALADVNLTDHFNQSALHWAAILRAPENFFALLFDKKISYDVNQFGKTPKELYETELTPRNIDICKSSSFSELGFHIVDWDVFPTLRELNRERALNHRNERFETKIIEKLKKHEQERANKKMIELTQDQLNERDHMGRTLLHRAVFNARAAEVEQLLKMSCDVTIKDEGGLTALELAQKLQKQFTTPVSPAFFSGKNMSIQAANCVVWKEIEDMISNYNKKNKCCELFNGLSL